MRLENWVEIADVIIKYFWIQCKLFPSPISCTSLNFFLSFFFLFFYFFFRAALFFPVAFNTFSFLKTIYRFIRPRGKSIGVVLLLTLHRVVWLILLLILDLTKLIGANYRQQQFLVKKLSIFVILVLVVCFTCLIRDKY